MASAIVVQLLFSVDTKWTDFFCLRVCYGLVLYFHFSGEQDICLLKSMLD
jgi:hypothetical protein